ncbi:type VI immunity family protein [Archangium sp.]|uniref:type VI immunity family protein n=1 Tax=Archangium sp. TaxID=1872627 RepID=UPI002D4674F2|nr:type VI immunity family protein [Archangium sp.]HYO53649.1 type VI immunity family protein [Archangium sp.]
MLAIQDEDGTKIAQLGLSASLYFTHGHTKEGRQAVAACFEAYWRMCGSQLKWAMQSSGRGWKRLGGRSNLSLPPEWLSSLSEDDSWHFNLHSGGEQEEAALFKISGLGSADWEEDLSYLKCTLPLTWYAGHPGSFPEFVLEWCNALRPLHGYGGVGILEAQDLGTRDAHAHQVYALARRFPGLDVDDPTSHVLDLKEGIKGVNWLTILGARFLSEVGGIGKIRSQVGPEFTFHEYPGGVMIQAGPKPQLGDVNRRRFPDSYRQLGSVLKGLRVKDHRKLHNDGLGRRFDDDATQAWLARFDGE